MQYRKLKSILLICYIQTDYYIYVNVMHNHSKVKSLWHINSRYSLVEKRVIGTGHPDFRTL